MTTQFQARKMQGEQTWEWAWSVRGLWAEPGVHEDTWHSPQESTEMAAGEGAADTQGREDLPKRTALLTHPARASCKLWGQRTARHRDGQRLAKVTQPRLPRSFPRCLTLHTEMKARAGMPHV